MKNRKNSPISFGITLTSSKRTRNKNFNRCREISTACQVNDAPGQIEQLSLYEFDCPRRKMPPDKPPFTPDMFNCDSMRLPIFHPPRKLTKEEERIQKGLERFRSQTAESHHPSGNSSLMVSSATWEFFEVVFVGTFVALKYMVIAISLITMIGSVICAGRPTRCVWEVKYRW